jgi:hypothetical protein
LSKLDSFLEKVIYPLLILIFTPSAIALGSYVNTGNIMNWLIQVPRWVWILFFGLNVVWMIAIIVTRRFKEIKKTGISGITVSRYGYSEIGTIDYASVKWRVIAPFKEPWGGLLNYNPKGIRISTPPRCLKCETKIEEEKCFWGGYIWKCPSCNFSKRSKKSYYKVSASAENIAQREIELRNK